MANPQKRFYLYAVAPVGTDICMTEYPKFEESFDDAFHGYINKQKALGRISEEASKEYIEKYNENGLEFFKSLRFSNVITVIRKCDLINLYLSLGRLSEDQDVIFPLFNKGYVTKEFSDDLTLAKFNMNSSIFPVNSNGAKSAFLSPVFLNNGKMTNNLQYGVSHKLRFSNFNSYLYLSNKNAGLLRNSILEIPEIKSEINDNILN